MSISSSYFYLYFLKQAVNYIKSCTALVHIFCLLTADKNRQHHTLPVSVNSRTSVSMNIIWACLFTHNQHRPPERGSYSKGMFQNITPTEGRQREAARFSLRRATLCWLPSQICKVQQLGVELVLPRPRFQYWSVSEITI